MGSPYREPRPKSPERLRVSKVNSAQFDPETGSLEVVVTFDYDRWCCNGSHEILDAITAVMETFEAASLQAEQERIKNLEKEYEGIFDESVRPPEADGD